MQGKYHVMPIKMTLLCLTACICQNLYAETDSTEPVLLPTLYQNGLSNSGDIGN